ncbi:substrate-binding domain-containing protein [Flavobacterium sp. Arc3]|jgi:phosphate transport system substrate-binding protein|uniref:PstS family phosphate ABC transporter substrate-binding protein n=1 Tax=Flavobacterium sp. Arc3 TaxID=3046686 RepID=UPI00352D967B
MKKLVRLPFFIIILFFVLFYGCKKSDGDKETILKGKATILVDETLKPLIEDEIAVFQGQYKAEIELKSRSENEVMRAFLKDTSRIVILSRKLNAEETKYFDQIKIKPKTTKIGTDAIAFIANKNNNDTLVALTDVILFMQGKEQKSIKGLVFDSPNSSTVRYMNALAGITEMPKEGVYSLKSNNDVVKFVSENDGMIGVVGLNWLYQPSSEMKDLVKNINVLSVKGEANDGFYAPTQNNLAEGKYPLARDLYIINCQGYSGLGMGFASFVAGDIGQRIILKAGLLPIRMPGRKVIFKIKSNKENEHE